LCETLSLSHDLGHTPFGHAGEEILNQCMKRYGGFDHNIQTLRIVTLLENKYYKFFGLNLTIETLDGLLKHNGTIKDVTPYKKILNKNFVIEKNYWSISASHDGYNKRYGVIHERQIEFFPENNKFIGQDKLLKKKNFKSSTFEIRFHLEPNVKIMKTQDGKSILIDIENEGWKFTAQGYTIDIETGLYFGKKNSFTENQNLFISGITQKEDQIIKWKFEKIT